MTEGFDVAYFSTAQDVNNESEGVEKVLGGIDIDRVLIREELLYAFIDDDVNGRKVDVIADTRA
jgi:hypothetical protein